jgi:hypothetical protein
MQSTFNRAGAALAITLSASLGLAADLPKEGTYDMYACLSGSTTEIALSADYKVAVTEQRGATVSNPPGGMLDKGAFHCLGMRTSIAGKDSSTMYCEVSFADGDKILSSFTLQADGTTARDTVAGTGKYEGLIMSGKVFPLGPYAVQKPGSFQSCNHQTGTYKMK